MHRNVGAFKLGQLLREMGGVEGEAKETCVYWKLLTLSDGTLCIMGQAFVCCCTLGAKRSVFILRECEMLPDLACLPQGTGSQRVCRLLSLPYLVCSRGCC